MPLAGHPELLIRHRRHRLGLYAWRRGRVAAQPDCTFRQTGAQGPALEGPPGHILDKSGARMPDLGHRRTPVAQKTPPRPFRAIPLVRLFGDERQRPSPGIPNRFVGQPEIRIVGRSAPGCLGRRVRPLRKPKSLRVAGRVCPMAA